MSPPLTKRRFVSLFVATGTWGKFFVFWEVRICCRVRLSRPIGRRDLGTRARASMCRIQRVSFQSKRLRRSVEPRRGAGRRNLGTRVRHPDESHPTHKTSAIAAPCKKSLPPQRQKTSPKSTRTKHSETDFHHAKAGALGGSSRRVWEVWRERGASFKRCPSPSKVFPYPSFNSPT